MPDPSTLDRTRLPPGATLGGRYRVEGLLGAGGMARVYLARDLRLGRRVAVKVVSPGLAGDPAAKARFMEEARTAAGLSHPGLVAVFDAGVEDGAPFLVMEHVEGRTLARFLREERIPPARAVEIAAAIADALAEIHAHGLVHRDVKPGNVLMASDGSVKVADLGIAEATRSRGAGRSPALGTPGYASPEQVRGDAVDGRADLYALGVIVYEMLTGRLPFDAESDPTPRRGKPIPPSRVGAAVPSALDAVVLTALAERPDARFPSIAAFRGALLEAAGGPPTVPSGSLRMGPSGAHRAARPGRWRRVAAAAFAMLLLVLAGSWLAAGTPFPGGGTSPNGLPAVSPSSTPARTTPAPAVDVVPTDGPSPSVGGVAVPPPTAEAEGDDGERDDEGGEEPCDNRGPGNCEDRGDGHGEGGGHHSD